MQYEKAGGEDCLIDPEYWVKVAGRLITEAPHNTASEFLTSVVLGMRSEFENIEADSSAMLTSS